MPSNKPMPLISANQEVPCAHPELDRSKRMLDRLSADTHHAGRAALALLRDCLCPNG